MAVRLPFFPDLPAHTYTVALDGVQYEVRLVYRERTAGWYMDLAGADGTWLLRGRRLSPGSSPQAGLITDGPSGVLWVVAIDEDDPRRGVELWYFDAAELAAAAPVETDLLPIVIS